MGKLYTCAVCGKTYQYKHTLQRHAKTKHGKSDESKYECYMCEKTFNRKNILNKYLKWNMHDYEYSDNDDATPPPMQRASVDLNDLTDIRAHEHPAFQSGMNIRTMCSRVRTVAGEVNHTSSNIHSL